MMWSKTSQLICTTNIIKRKKERISFIEYRFTLFNNVWSLKVVSFYKQYFVTSQFKLPRDYLKLCFVYQRLHDSMFLLISWVTGVEYS